MSERTKRVTKTRRNDREKNTENDPSFSRACEACILVAEDPADLGADAFKQPRWVLIPILDMLQKKSWLENVDIPIEIAKD